MDEVERLAAAQRRVQRQAQGRTAEQIGGGLVAARAMARQAGRDEEVGPDAVWEVEEWERIATLVCSGSWPVYDVALDEQAQAWLAEWEQRMQARRRTRQRQAEQQVRERVQLADRVQVRAVLPGEAGRRLRALAEGLGWSAERVLAVLAEHVQVDADGLVHVPPVAITPAPPGLEAYRERLPAVYREPPRYGREANAYGEDYLGPALDW
ncbi:hypothetical protein [Kitasatospora sp. CB01950]|uniref:hypothetical protein n=1 Tax=Kitasatospora sp. CB01950 TaxID=1703930 RepID=UPI000960C748|nr:hypothetical protein [Kitasatospora sp. CB01950]OKI95132.1 hypothetical protein AMK19_33260 [Kitasatospora sp. CB01950]